MIHRSLVTAGYKGDPLASEARLVPDKELTKIIRGTRFELKLEPAAPFAGKPAELRYHVTDEATGAAVNNLEPYLGAWGHTLILSEDATDYLHSHPTEMLPEDLSVTDRARLRGGPNVTFETFFRVPAITVSGRSSNAAATGHRSIHHLRAADEVNGEQRNKPTS